MRADRAVIRAAQACALGIPGLRMLQTHDPVEFQLLENLTQRAADTWDELARQQAAYTANAVGKMLGG